MRFEGPDVAKVLFNHLLRYRSVNFSQASGPRTQACCRFCLSTYGKIRRYQYVPSRTSPMVGNIRRYQYIPCKTSPTTESFWLSITSTYTFRIKVLLRRLRQSSLHLCCCQFLSWRFSELSHQIHEDLAYGRGMRHVLEVPKAPRTAILPSLTIAQVLPTDNANFKVTICGPSPSYMGSWSYEPNTMNL